MSRNTYMLPNISQHYTNSSTISTRLLDIWISPLCYFFFISPVESGYRFSHFRSEIHEHDSDTQVRLTRSLPVLLQVRERKIAQERMIRVNFKIILQNRETVCFAKTSDGPFKLVSPSYGDEVRHRLIADRSRFFSARVVYRYAAREEKR